MRMIVAIGIGASLLFSSYIHATDLVPFGSEWTYLHPTNGLDGDPSLADPDFFTTWFSPEFDTTTPTAWAAPSAAPFAYGEADDGGNPNVFHINAFTPDDPSFTREVGTFLQQPPGERYTTYFRTSFTTETESDSIGIELLADDGAKIYLNGEELVSWNCCEIADPGTPADYIELSRTTGNENNYVIGRVLDGQVIPPGEHTLAVEIHQAAVDSSDMGFSMRLIEGYVQDTLIETGQNWTYFKGTEEPSGGTLDWATAQFDDAAWLVGPEGFGYETDPNAATANLFGTPLDDMDGNYTSLYLRRKFSVTEDPSTYETLFLDVDYDDGFVAYVNGTEVLATVLDTDDNPATGIPFDVPGQDLNAGAESTNGDGRRGVTFGIDLADFPNLLRAGDDNVLAFHGINRSPSSDYVIAQLELVGIGERGRTVQILGDYDGSGELDVPDVDLLMDAIRSGEGGSEFDLDNSGEVDRADLGIWVEDLRNTFLGDANMDGEFNSRDFVTVFTTQEYEDDIDGNSTWAEGDWNADGDFNTRDFVAAFAGGGYEKGPRPAPVPEPAAGMLLIFGLGGLVVRPRN